jgi:hypothetical protein
MARLVRQDPQEPQVEASRVLWVTPDLLERQDPQEPQVEASRATQDSPDSPGKPEPLETRDLLERLA